MVKKKGQQEAPKTNIIDQVVAYFAPEKAIKRLKARKVLDFVNSYTGARKDRRSMSAWVAPGGDADSDLLPDLGTLRERSRDLIRNNPLASGAINTKVTNVVGIGLSLQSSIDWEYLRLTEEAADEWEKNTEREFKLWAESFECDIQRTSTFAELQGLIFRSVLENGDAFVLLTQIARSFHPYKTTIQLIEADKVCNPNNASDDEKLAGGVKKDQFGAPVAYYIMETHPGARFFKDRTWKEVQAFNKKLPYRSVLHLFNKIRIGQTRGVPDLAPVIECFKQLDTYTQAEIHAAVVSAMFTVFVKSESPFGMNPMEPVAETQASSSDSDIKLGPGIIVDLMPGEDITTTGPGRPNPTFDPFVKAILQQIGVCLEIPFEVLIKHFDSSYSAARAALLEAWRYFENRRVWLARSFCQPIYEAWLYEAVAIGRIKAPGFLQDPAVRKAYCRAQWIGPARGQIDELKEVNAAIRRVESGISTLEEETAQLTGGDWELKHRQRTREQKMRIESGLIVDPALLLNPQGGNNV